MPSPKTIKVSKSPTFKLSLGIFCAVGFVQLMAVGAAYTTRAGSTREVIKYESVAPVVLVKPVQEKAIVHNAPARTLSQILADQGVKSLKLGETPSWQTESSDDFPVPGGNSQGYVVRDPLVGRLLEEARELEKLGDMGGMILKLEEAKALDAMEPALLYALGRLDEMLDKDSQARDHYLKIIKIGFRAGKYRKMAWAKIQQLSNPQKMEGLLELGMVNIARAKDLLSAKVTIPIKKVKGEQEVNSDLVEVQVHFYDRTKDGEVIKADPNANIISKWQNRVVDWNAHGEEVLSVDYSLPKVDAVQRVLFGDKVYYGQVVEVYYKGELQDIVAHPNTLHKIHGNNNGDASPVLDPLGLPDLNLDNPLLPPLEPLEPNRY